MRHAISVTIILLAASTLLAAGHRPFQVDLYLSEQTDYVNTMVQGFQEQMNQEGLVDGRNVRYTTVLGIKGPGDWKDCGDLADRVNKSPAHLRIVFGTAAGQALTRCVPQRQIPIIFAGVTDPVATGLLTSLNEPPRLNATGILYGLPPHALLRFLKNLFPEPTRVGFLYNPNFPPDIQYKLMLEQAEPLEGLSIKTIAFKEDTTISEPSLNECQVFTGWYGLYTYQAEFRRRYPKTIFIGANLSQLEKGALAVIAPSMIHIGKDAGKLVAELILRQTPLEKITPRQPSRFQIGVNLALARSLNVSIPGSVISIADVVIK